MYYPFVSDTLEEYKTYIDSLPVIDSPEIFGMHENANISYQVLSKITLTSLYRKKSVVDDCRLQSELVFHFVEEKNKY